MVDPYLVYACQNTTGTQTKYFAGTSTVAPHPEHEGICMGQAVLWCRSMLDGKDPKLTQPDSARAAALQLIYQRHNRPNDVFDQVSMPGYPVEGKGKKICTLIKTYAGIYLIRYTHHALAAANTENKLWHFFDPDEGLYEYDDSGLFDSRFAYGNDLAHFNGMWAFSGTLGSSSLAS